VSAFCTYVVDPGDRWGSREGPTPPETCGEPVADGLTDRCEKHLAMEEEFED